MHGTHHTIRPMAPGERRDAQACYRRNGYDGTIRSEDDVLVALDEERIVGVVRIAQERGARVLRGLFIDEDHRGEGLGTRMLHALVGRWDAAPCWLICGPHLIRFYGQAGFRLTEDEAAPRFLQERVSRYRDTYGPQCLLRRLA